MKYNVIERIKKYIEENEILHDYETYEQMPVSHFSEINCLNSFIKKDLYTPFLINMAIMYVSQGLIYAQSQLSKEAIKNYLIYFRIDIDENVDEMEGTSVHVLFTRKGKKHLQYFKEPVDIKNTKMKKYLKDIIGLSDFSCYLAESIEDGLQQYSFIPKILELHIRQ